MSTHLRRDNWIEFSGIAVVKNVKLGEDAHQELSMTAAALKAQKGVLCTVLVHAALAEFNREKIANLLANYVDPDDDKS